MGKNLHGSRQRGKKPNNLRKKRVRTRCVSGNSGKRFSSRIQKRIEPSSCRRRTNPLRTGTRTETVQGKIRNRRLEPTRKKHHILSFFSSPPNTLSSILNHNTHSFQLLPDFVSRFPILRFPRLLPLFN